eukprot:11672495-Prorocentrum_lima.AAC.1
MEGHTCRWLAMEQYHPDTVRILTGTTARITLAQQGFTITGLGPRLVDRSLTSKLGAQWARHERLCTTACHSP